MRRPTLPLAATALSLVLSGLLSPVAAQAASSDVVAVSSGTRATAAQQLLDLINVHRRSKGLAPVKYSPTLSQIAQGQSDRLVRQEVVNHTDTFMTDPRAGSWDAVGEIHATAWRTSVTDLMDWWKGSTAHNKVLTDPRMEVVGIGLTYVDGSLAGTRQGWRLVGTVASYGYPPGKAPADTRATVTGPSVAPASSYPLRGAIGTQYRRLGGAARFGAPAGNERCGLVGGGCHQGFAQDVTFYWSPGTGAWPVKFSGGIGQKFAAGGYERGYGYPTNQETGDLAGGGYYQAFRSGSTVHKILWSPRTGAHAIKETGAIGQRWKAAGYERGYGYPTTDEYRVGNEVRQGFSSGRTIHWSSVTGRTWVTRG